MKDEGRRKDVGSEPNIVYDGSRVLWGGACRVEGWGELQGGNWGRSNFHVDQCSILLYGLGVKTDSRAFTGCKGCLVVRFVDTLEGVHVLEVATEGCSEYSLNNHRCLESS